MRDEEMEEIIIECLDALDQGEPIGKLLARYPNEAAELRPILETAAQLTVLNLQPTVEAQTKSRRVFLNQAQTLKAGNGVRWRRPFWQWLLRPLAGIAVLIVALIGFVSITDKALPGDNIYGAKLFVEGVRLSLSGNGASTQELIRQMRIREIEEMLRLGREGAVSYEGVVDEKMDNLWRIEGVLTDVAAAEIQGDPYVNDVVTVAGWVANSRLVANTITLLEDNSQEPTPAPTAAETALPTETAVPTMLPTETITPTSEPTDTPQPTPSPTTTPTMTPTPTLTATPTTSPTPTNEPTATVTEEDDHGGGDDDDDDDVPEEEEEEEGDNSGSGSSNRGSGSSNSGSGSGDDDPDDDNSGSGSSNSGSGSSNSGSGSGSD
jgi:uncharacterized membrane protein YgcG